MDTALEKTGNQIGKRSLLIQLIALFLYLFICGILALPILTVGGDECSTYKLTIFLLIFGRLAWQIYKHTFRFRDYFIYFAVTVVFCVWADYELGHLFTK
jgi:hypothetical protein